MTQAEAPPRPPGAPSDGVCVAYLGPALTAGADRDHSWAPLRALAAWRDRAAADRASRDARRGTHGDALKMAVDEVRGGWLCACV